MKAYLTPAILLALLATAGHAATQQKRATIEDQRVKQLNYQAVPGFFKLPRRGADSAKPRALPPIPEAMSSSISAIRRPGCGNSTRTAIS